MISIIEDLLKSYPSFDPPRTLYYTYNDILFFVHLDLAL